MHAQTAFVVDVHLAVGEFLHGELTLYDSEWEPEDI